MIRLKGVLRENPSLACLFCKRTTDDEHVYGKIYTLKDITCHYFCVLLSSCAIQRGNDNDGILGFLYKDIVREHRRSQKHKCSYCGEMGATLGCCISQCRKQFHLPCGREHNAISIFQGNYKSFCEKHIPKQNMPMDVVAVSRTRRIKYNNEMRKHTKAARCDIEEKMAQEDGCICLICYSPVLGFPSPTNFWPPCCARDVWFHRMCLQRMALSAGIHYLKCPLCNDKKQFQEACVSQGIYVPDRDAAWELEQNAFAEIYERPEQCSAETCKCLMGRDHDADSGPWELKLCLLCGSSGMHTGCLYDSTKRYICTLCGKVPIENVEELEMNLQKVLIPSSNNSGRSGPIMTSRMSLRRTKPNYKPHTLRPAMRRDCPPPEDILTNTERSRLELNLSTPKHRSGQFNQATADILTKNKMYSPMKLLDEKLQRQLTDLDECYTKLLVDRLREKFNKPQPMSEKRRILNGIFKDILSESLSEQIGIVSPRKSIDVAASQQTSLIAKTDSSSIKEHEECTPSKTSPGSETVENKSAFTIKFSPLDKKIDMETFMNRYLSEVDRNSEIKTNKDQVQELDNITNAKDNVSVQTIEGKENITKVEKLELSQTTEIMKVKKKVRFLDLTNPKHETDNSNLKHNSLKPILKRKVSDDCDPETKKIKINDEHKVVDKIISEAKEEKPLINIERDGKVKNRHKKLDKKFRNGVDFRNISNIKEVVDEEIKKEHYNNNIKPNDVYYNSTANKSNQIHKKRDKSRKRIKNIKATVKFNITESKTSKKLKRGFKRSKSKEIAIKIQFKKLSDLNKFKNTLADTKPVNLKQTVLNFSPESKTKGNSVIQPEIKPKIRHKKKKKLTNNHMKQMSLDAFFQQKPYI